jgi:hypothetical protein
MSPIRIRTTLQSDTLHLPVLRPLIGRPVEIIVRDESAAGDARPGTGDWDAAARAAHEALRERGTYDFDAWREQRDFDASHAHDHRR